ncbi:peroxiredoxin family protein [Microcoleus sp.]|uniref:peroxiredoxin family protein n=1 Tax=Microcoleus sp. TaxID=44472 RepID=UPI003594426D
MPEMLEVGAVAPEFLLCDEDYRYPKSAVDINGEPISIRDFDDKCLILIFIGEPRDRGGIASRVEFLKKLSIFADECKSSGVEIVAAGMNELGMMQECVEKAEITFRYIAADNHQTPMLHDYNAYAGVTSAFTYVVADGKIQERWNQTYPKSFDEAHFQEVLAYIAANNLA